MSFEFDEGANRRRITLFHRHAHAVGCSSRWRSIEALDTHHDAIAFLTFLADLDESGERYARDGILQNRMRDASGLQGGDGKPCGKRSEPKCEREAKTTPARHTCGRDARNSQH